MNTNLIRSLVTGLVMLFVSSASSSAPLTDIDISTVPPALRFRVLEQLPEQWQYHVDLLKSLDTVQIGEIRQKRFFLTGNQFQATARRGTAEYHLVRPASVVEDAEIRGYLDGRIVHHDINQGTAYHFRLGRRFTGGTSREFEIKRVVMRWKLNNIPRRSLILDARLAVTAESVSTASPIFRKGHYLPLHVFAYPLKGDWVEGQGGERHDNYTSASAGEVTWAAARHGEKSWPVPGALQAGVSALAAGELNAGLQPVVLKNRRLNRQIEQMVNSGNDLNLLLKLDDQEEDRWGTEMGFFASDFGDDKDFPSKRPRLDLTAEIRHPMNERVRDFKLKAGEKVDYEVMSHPGSKVLLAGDIVSDEQGMQPQVWVRGGKGSFNAKTPWTLLQNPVIRDWDWSQYRLSNTPSALDRGQPLTMELKEYWVTHPLNNRPRLMLLSPSGKVLDMLFNISTTKPYVYDLAYTPDEPGLWRYLWYFLPTKEAKVHSHENTGLFFVR